MVSTFDMSAMRTVIICSRNYASKKKKKLRGPLKEIRTSPATIKSRTRQQIPYSFLFTFLSWFLFKLFILPLPLNSSPIVSLQQLTQGVNESLLTFITSATFHGLFSMSKMCLNLWRREKLNFIPIVSFELPIFIQINNRIDSWKFTSPQFAASYKLRIYWYTYPQMLSLIHISEPTRPY